MVSISAVELYLYNNSPLACYVASKLALNGLLLLLLLCSRPVYSLHLSVMLFKD